MYLWVLSTNVTIDIRFKAKVSYLARSNEQNHPRLDKFFTLEESNEIDRQDEEKLFNEIYKDEMKYIRKEAFKKEDMNEESSLDGWNS